MNRRRSAVPILVILLAALVPILSRHSKPARPAGESHSEASPRASAASGGATPAAGTASVPGAAGQGASTVGSVPSVPIDEEHLFAGEINRRGKPVGFHSRPGGRDPESARLVEVLDGPNAAGVYTAQVEIHDPRSGSWLRKTSTFYPDRMQRAEVLQAILHAFESRQGSGETFRGPSGAGFTIEGYFQNGRINTAYPIYSRR